MRFFKPAIIALLLLPALSYANPAPAPRDNNTPPLCQKGTISSVKYNSDESMSMMINGMEVYTNRKTSLPFIFNAFLLGVPVAIYTTDCWNGGGFAVIRFE